MVARLPLTDEEDCSRSEKHPGESIICTRQPNSLEVGERRSYCFLLWVCEEQAPGFPLSLPLFVVAPLPSPGYLQHSTPRSRAGLLLGEGISGGFGGEGWVAAEPQRWRARGWAANSAWLHASQGQMNFKPAFVSERHLCPQAPPIQPLRCNAASCERPEPCAASLNRSGKLRREAGALPWLLPGHFCAGCPSSYPAHLI